MIRPTEDVVKHINGHCHQLLFDHSLCRGFDLIGEWIIITFSRLQWAFISFCLWQINTSQVPHHGCSVYLLGQIIYLLFPRQYVDASWPSVLSVIDYWLSFTCDSLIHCCSFFVSKPRGLVVDLCGFMIDGLVKSGIFDICIVNEIVSNPTITLELT